MPKWFPEMDEVIKFILSKGEPKEKYNTLHRALYNSEKEEKLGGIECVEFEDLPTLNQQSIPIED